MIAATRQAHRHEHAQRADVGGVGERERRGVGQRRQRRLAVEDVAVQRPAGAHDHALHADRRLVGIEQPADERRPAQQEGERDETGAQPDLEPGHGGAHGRRRYRHGRSPSESARPTVAAMDVRAVLFDFGNTLFAHAPLDATIIDAADRLGLAQSPTEAADLAHAHRRVAASDRRKRSTGVTSTRPCGRRAGGTCTPSTTTRLPGLGAAIYAAMHDPAQWLPYLDSAAVLRGLHERGRRRRGRLQHRVGRPRRVRRPRPRRRRRRVHAVVRGRRGEARPGDLRHRLRPSRRRSLPTC